MNQRLILMMLLEILNLLFGMIIKEPLHIKLYQSEGFLGASYYDSTFTDDRGYYNIQLPRNNVYRIHFIHQIQMMILETIHHYLLIGMELQISMMFI